MIDNICSDPRIEMFSDDYARYVSLAEAEKERTATQNKRRHDKKWLQRNSKASTNIAQDA